MGKLAKKFNLLRNKFKFPIKISLLYFIISFLWIMLSDLVSEALISDKKMLLFISTLKGWFYVIVITIILFLLLNKTSKRVEAAESRLRKNFEELSAAHRELGRVNKELALSEERLKQKYEELKLAQESIKQSHEELTLLYEKLAASDEELVRQFNQTQILAYNDSLTGLPNRLCLQERLTEIIQTTPDKVALLYIDLDNFKNINDSFGHHFGDAVLVEMGNRLARTVDGSAFVARLGGDEFAIVTTDVSPIERLNGLADQLLSNLSASFTEKEISINMSASIGVAVYPDHAAGFEELLKNADTTMYEAKKKGKRQYAIYDPAMNQE